MSVFGFLMSCLYSAVESFCYCFIKVPIITSVFHVPILLAYSFCNHLPENLVAEANLEVFSFFYCVAACNAEDIQSNCSGLPLDSVTSAM